MHEDLSRADAEPQLRRDRGDLRRGAVVNGIGSLFKVMVPVLTALIVRLYGAEVFGLFIVAHAGLLFASRLCLVGLDKALLWWIPQQPAGQALTAWRPVVAAVVITTSATTVVLLAFADPLAAVVGGDQAALPLRIMTLSLLPMTLTELLLAACTGLKRMGPTVVVKETLLPLAVAGFGLLLYPLALASTGLAIGFTAAHLAALGLAFLWWRRLFPRSTAPRVSAVPPRLRSYALPIWFAELSNSLLLRMDVYAVALLAGGDLQWVGIYGTVVTIANAVRQIRRAFDPMVLVLTAEIGARRAKDRLAAGLSYATTLVLATQLPVLAVIVGFAPWLMQFFGAAFDVGTTALVVLTAVWVINSPFSLAGVVVQAHGHATLTLANVWLAIGVQAVALWLLVPPYGLVGAAASVGIAYGVQAAAQVLQMRRLTGAWNFSPAVARPLVWALIASIAAGVAWSVVPDARSLAWRVVIVAAFGAVYGYSAAAARASIRKTASAGIATG